MKSTGGVYNTIFGEIDASKGMFRKGNVTAGVSYFPNFDKVERLTNELVKFISEKMNDDLTIGLPLAIVNSEDKQEYIQALIDTRKEDNIQIFRDFMRDQYEKYLSNEIKKFEDGFSSKGNKGFSFLF